jgi:hypothetical protein
LILPYQHSQFADSLIRMDTAHLVEALLDGAIRSGLCPELRGCTPATGEVLPAQYLLLVRDLPGTRSALRQAALGLLALLDAAEAGYACDGEDGCGKFQALLSAPDWLLRPAEPDSRDLDVALLLERERGGQGWPDLLEALHQAGSVEWQPAIRRCREMMRFEVETGGDLAKLMGVQVSPGEGLVTEVTARSAAAPETPAR